jgi:nicotinamidase-related amidase
MAVDIFSSHMNAEQIKLDPARAAVIVVDMINEFCKPGGKMVLPGYEALAPPQLAVIEAARAAGAPVVWVHDSHRRGMRRDREWVKRTPARRRRDVGNRDHRRSKGARGRDPCVQAPLFVVLSDGPRRHPKGYACRSADCVRRRDEYLRPLDGPRRFFQRL